jgi:diadenosine tetraphosphate (Ap4A) HIT family hydrolase
LGWLVIILRHHAEALHDLSLKEAEELERLQWPVAKAFAGDTGCMRE